MPGSARSHASNTRSAPTVLRFHCPLIPLSDAVIYAHLAGEHMVGVYPLLAEDTCHFLAVDFDEDQWKDDARAFVPSCEEFRVPVALEISRSGNGAHAGGSLLAGCRPATPVRSAPPSSAIRATVADGCS